jgi:hypothetical protein
MRTVDHGGGCGGEALLALLLLALLTRPAQIQYTTTEDTWISTPLPFHKTPGLMTIGRLVRSSGHVPAVVGVEQVVERGVVLVVWRDLRVVHLDTQRGERQQLARIKDPK